MIGWAGDRLEGAEQWSAEALTLADELNVEARYQLALQVAGLLLHRAGESAGAARALGTLEEPAEESFHLLDLQAEVTRAQTELRQTLADRYESLVAEARGVGPRVVSRETSRLLTGR